MVRILEIQVRHFKMSHLAGLVELAISVIGNVKILILLPSVVFKKIKISYLCEVGMR